MSATVRLSFISGRGGLPVCIGRLCGVAPRQTPSTEAAVMAVATVAARSVSRSHVASGSGEVWPVGMHLDLRGFE